MKPQPHFPFRLALLLAGLLLFPAARAADWPQFLGPARNGTYDGPKLASTWPKEGPAILWKKPVAQGFAGPAVAAGKLVLFHRNGDKETIECLDATNGSPVWKFDYPSGYRDDFGFDEGPRATPAIVDGKVYTFGAEGALHCLDFATGKKIWSVDAKARFAAGKGFFGLACSPLVEGEAVLLNVGGRNGAGIVAFQRDTGKVLWQATDDEASYSSPVMATLDGQRAAVFFTRAGLAVLNPKDGAVRYQFPWRARMNASVNAASPLVVGDLIFLTTSYNTGAVLLRAHDGKLDKVWSNDESLSCHYASCVHRDGFLYGYDGRQEEGPSLRCVELKTGKVRWTRAGFGSGTVTLAGEQLVLMREDGQVALAAASPEKFSQLASAQILPFGVRPYPALADGRLYARSKTTLVCVDLKPTP